MVFGYGNMGGTNKCTLCQQVYHVGRGHICPVKEKQIAESSEDIAINKAVDDLESYLEDSREAEFFRYLVEKGEI